MSGSHTNTFPKLHNAMWPGLVGKGSAGAEPTIDLDTMLDLTAAAEVDGIKFDGVDLFLYEPHINIDISDDDLKAVADKIAAKGFVVGSVVAPVWFDALGDGRRAPAREFPDGHPQGVPDRQEAARAGRAALRRGPHRLGVVARPTGPRTPRATRRRSPRPSSRPPRSPGITANGWRPRARSAGAACTRGGRWSTCSSASASPRRSASRPTWRTRCFTRSAKTPPRTGSCPRTSTGRTAPPSTRPCKTLTAALRPWTIDFHVAQNDATVFGSGTHDHTGRHCLATDPNGKLDIPHHAGFWLRDENGKLTKKLRHICWDGCMFPNAVMMNPKTWNDILAAMIAVRDAHGWNRVERPRSLEHCQEMTWREETSQHRPGRLRLHGPDAFQRLQARQRLLRRRVPAGA